MNTRGQVIDMEETPEHAIMDDLGGFIDGLPKAELHLHIEGTLEPGMMFALAARNGVTLPYASVEALRAAYDFADLQAVREIYYRSRRLDDALPSAELREEGRLAILTLAEAIPRTRGRRAPSTLAVAS